MAGTHSNYTKGEMEIAEQKETFSGFMGMTIYGGGVIALGLIFAILTVGGVGLSWFPALIITVVLGILMGILLKLNAAWYAAIMLLGGVTAVICFIAGLFF
ncbi:MAG: aa3-type cytochrome c oxidase subunit IV [Hellea sp.]|nr:aa3-type cytochrome c oxidase subunit IV [Hellea sp.]